MTNPHQLPLTFQAVTPHRYATSAPILVAKLNQMGATSLSESEIQRAFAGCVLSAACTDAARQLSDAGIIFYDDVQNTCRIETVTV